MADKPVLSAALREVVTLDGVAYTLRAPTVADAAGMLLAEMQPPAATQARIHAVMAAWLTDQGKPDLAQRLADFAAAEEDLLALLGTAPPAYDREGVTQWRAEVREEERGLRRALIRARAAAEAAELAAWDAPPVAKLREEVAGAALRGARRHVEIALVAIGDRPVTPPAEAEIAAIPVAHLLALAPRAQALLRPSEAARKN